LLNGCRQRDLQRPTVICEVANNGSNPLNFPNNEFGMGIVDAYASISRFFKNSDSFPKIESRGLQNLWRAMSHRRTIEPLLPSYIIPIIPQKKQSAVG
jgi:hypothetical protein